MDGGTRLTSLSGSESGTDPGSRGWVNPKRWAGREGRLGSEVPGFSSLLHRNPCPPKHNPSWADRFLCHPPGSHKLPHPQMGHLHEAVLRASSKANGAWAHLLHCSMPGRHWAGGHPSPPQSVAGGPELTRDPKAHSARSISASRLPEAGPVQPGGPRPTQHMSCSTAHTQAPEAKTRGPLPPTPAGRGFQHQPHLNTLSRPFDVRLWPKKYFVQHTVPRAVVNTSPFLGPGWVGG